MRSSHEKSAEKDKLEVGDLGIVSWGPNVLSLPAQELFFGLKQGQE